MFVVAARSRTEVIVGLVRSLFGQRKANAG